MTTNTQVAKPIAFVDENEEESPRNQHNHQFYIYYNDVYEVNLPPKHRFPMYKYRMAREKVQQIIQQRRQETLLQSSNDVSSSTLGIHCEFIPSPLASVEDLQTTHCSNYIKRYLAGELTEKETRNTGFPWSQQHVNRSLSSVGGTIAAAQRVCEHLLHQQQQQKLDALSSSFCWGAHVAGGTHHAFKDYGEGFCIFNDIAVAANVMLQRFPNTVNNILILDLDVHQGNGSAVLFQQKSEVTTFSLHCRGNYFSPKQMSDIDIELPIGCNDGTYLQTLHYWLNQLLFASDSSKKYDLIFFQAGVDVLSSDRLGKMNLTSKGVERRNEMIYHAIDRYNHYVHRCGLVITMGGGYPQSKSDTSIIDAHAQVYVGTYDFLSSLKDQT